MKIRDILVLLLAVFMSGCSIFGGKSTSSELEEELNKNLYTGSFQPVQPFTFDENKYSVDVNDDCFKDDLANRKKCWLDNLPNSEDYVAVADSKFKGTLGYASSGISAEKGKYEIVSQWVRFFNANPIDAEGNPIEGHEHKVGVGARIVAHITTSKAGINLADMFAVAAAAENSDVNGSLLFTIQGIHGKGIDTYTPKISKLDVDNLQKALESIQNIKTLLHHDETIHLTAQVVAIRAPEEESIVESIKVPDDNETLKAKLGAIKKQGWVYVGYFDDSGAPNGPTNLVVAKASDIKGTLTTRASLHVRSGYPTFPMYRLRSIIDSVEAGSSVEVIKYVNTGINKYWALVEY